MGSGEPESVQGGLFGQYWVAATHHNLRGFATLMRPSMANAQQGEPMLETYFSAPKTLRRLRGGISGPHIDSFADDLERDGYATASAVRYIRAAAHLGCFVQRKGGLLRDIDLNILDSSAVADALISDAERLAITRISE